ncbi:tetratricopeptide repeat protein [Sandaracinus amylolyticus]|uniref:tetratricopeptide repeat protein n=1 Tax=Sandaracinus amylolyticus TaxID=927083 RepID=UPI001F2A112C|nr:tetratricopeptide repeat protein [Sandaracinus amylolyticus]UJR82676.1 Hypothetical protein I5071_47410 [Sandaracinus amylolyticus]
MCALSCLSSTIALADPPVRDDVRALSAYLRSHPSDVAALIERSELYRREGNPEGALADLRVAAALAPDEPRVHAQRAVVLHAMGRHEEALAELDAYVERAPGPGPELLALRARILVRMERLDDAVADYDAALALREEVELYLERGRLLEQLGRIEDAARGYDEGLRVTDAAVLRVESIELDLRIGRADRALVHVDEGLARAPARARWLLLRARALDALARQREARAARDEALTEIERRLVRRPTAALHVERGEALLALGRADDALAAATRARSLAPRLGDAIDLELRARRAIDGGAR